MAPLPDAGRPLGSIAVNHVAAEREQRAHEPAVDIRDPGEAGGPGAAEQPEQHGPRLIARGVADEHPLRA